MNRKRVGDWVAHLARLRRSRFAGALAGVGALTAAEMVLGLASAILLARSLGLDGLGIYSVAIAAVTLSAIAVEIGLPSLVLREVAHGLGDGARSHKASVLRFATIYILASSTIAVAALTAYGDALLSTSAGDPVVAIAAWLIPLGAMGKIFGNALAGEQRVVAGLMPQRMLKPGLFAVALLIAVVAAPGWLTPARAISLQLVAAVGALAVGCIQFHRQFGAILWQGPGTIAWKHWASASARLGTATGIRAAQPSLLIILVSNLAGAENAGLFRVAQRTGGLIAMATTVIHTTAGPRFARLNAERDIAGLQRLLRYLARTSSSITVLTFLGFALIGEWLLGAVFGSAFAAAYSAVIVLGSGEVVRPAFGPATLLLSMTRHEGQAALAHALGVIIALLVTWLLAPGLGAYGGAYGVFAGTTALAAYSWWQVRRLHGLDSSILGLPRNP